MTEMRILLSTLLCAAVIGLAGCNNAATTAKTEQVRVAAAGEKAEVGHLSYTIVDSQVLTQLGEDPSQRIPRERFMLVQISVTNSSNVDNPIPSVELVGDSGTTYQELSDGSGAPNWLGIVRHVGPGQTERGNVLFDAPAAHYKVRFKDEMSNNEILADLPLSFEREKLNNATVTVPDMPTSGGASGSQKAK